MNTPTQTGQAKGSQMRINPEEMAIIKSTFKNNEALLKLMRKMFLPELDPQAPMAQMVDLYRTIQTKDRDPVTVWAELTARNMVIDHVENVLMQLYVMALSEELTPEQIKDKAKQDSSK